MWIIGNTNSKGNNITRVKGDRYFRMILNGKYINHSVFERVLILVK